MTDGPMARTPPWTSLRWALGLARAPHLMPAELGWRHGGLARFRLMRHHILAVTHPAVARHILLSDHYERSYHYRTYQAILGNSLFATDGPHWARRRRMVQPAFRPDQTLRFAQVMRDGAAALLERWEAERLAGRPVDALAETQRLTLAVIGRALLSTDVAAADADRFADAVRDTLVLVRRRNTALVTWPLWLPIPANRRLKRTRRILDDYVGGHIARRLASDGNGRADILDELRAATAPDTGEHLTAEALLEEAKTLFVTGYETTAVSLAWALYALAGAPEASRKWHEEVDRVLPPGADSSALNPADFPYVAAVVSETLRLYPTVYNLARVCVADDVVEGHRIFKGETALISIYGIHRSPELWEAPEEFRPERFLDKAVRRDAFLPFGSGKHLCVGAGFAQAEMITALVLIGRRYGLKLVDPAPPGMTARVTLAPARPIPIALEPR